MIPTFSMLKQKDPRFKASLGSYGGHHGLDEAWSKKQTAKEQQQRKLISNSPLCLKTGHYYSFHPHRKHTETLNCLAPRDCRPLSLDTECEPPGGLEVIWGMPGPHTKVSLMAHGTISGQQPIHPGTTKARAQPGLCGSQDGGWRLSPSSVFPLHSHF